MSNQILHKRSAVPAKVPATTDLAFGELAVNHYDGKAYIKANNGGADFIADLTANQNITVTGDVSGSGTTSLALTLPTTGIVANTYNNSATQVTPLTFDAKGRATGTGVPITITPAFSSITGKPSTLAGYGIIDALPSSYTPTWASLTGKPTTLTGYGIVDAVASNLLGANNGVAQLDATGKVPVGQLPASVLGGMNFQGTWDANSNTPTITSSTGTKGHYYKVATAGSTSIDGTSNWTVGDLILFNGATWDIVQGGSSDVVSVFGRIGAVTLLSSDISTALGFTPYSNANPSGFISGNQTISVLGDATGSGTTSITLTLSNSGVTAGTTNNSATSNIPITFDIKGRATTIGAPVTITPAWSSITSKPTTIAGYGIVDALTLGATAGTALGTASAGVATTAAKSDHVHAMPSLDSLSNLSLTPKAINDLLQWNGTNWVNKSLSAAGIQPAGAYLTSNQAITISGDGSATGTTSLSLTLAATGVVAGTYNNITVNSKGLATGGSNIAYLTANQNITVTGDITGTGTTAINATLANSGATAGTYGSGTSAVVITNDAKGRITNISTAAITPAGIGAVASTLLGAVNGVAQLDAGGKVPVGQLPASVLGGMNFQGTWNANTNTPTIVSGTGTKGYYYKVATAGATTINGNSNWTVGDLIVYNGTAWDLVQGGNSDVTSVFGRVGAVSLTSTDVTGALGFTPYNSTNPNGYITGNQGITVSGDATGSGTTAISITLAASGIIAGTYNNSATAVSPITFDAKGRATGVGSAVTITPEFSSITGKPATVAGYGITDAMLVGQVIDGGTF
jgi:hypothetical protein